MIPQNIKSEHILKAIEEVERSGIPRDRSSDRYDLEYNKKIYPPKYIISLANKYANGNELDHSEFSGGDEANNFLESLGFNIVNKQMTLKIRHMILPQGLRTTWKIYIRLNSIKVEEGHTFPFLLVQLFTFAAQ